MQKLYYSLVMLLTFSILGVFTSQDLLQFFITFEFELVPMYFLIAIWGGKNRAYAAMKFLLYTFTGGILMLGSLLFLFFTLKSQAFVGVTGTLDFRELAQNAANLPKAAQDNRSPRVLPRVHHQASVVPVPHMAAGCARRAPTPISMILAGTASEEWVLMVLCAYAWVSSPTCLSTSAIWIMYLGAFNIVWAAIGSPGAGRI